MGKKPGPAQVNAKQAAKIADKTFGMKNKKSKKNQKLVQQITATVVGNQKQKDSASQKPSEKQIKKEHEQKLKVLGIYRPVPKKETITAESVAIGLEDLDFEEEPPVEETLEDHIERERKVLQEMYLPNITWEDFVAWKKAREEIESKEQPVMEKSKKETLTGRELYEKKHEVFIDDEGAYDAFTPGEDLEIGDEALFCDPVV